jgi:hypothetical protein
MAFWRDSKGPEPLRQHRWYIAFNYGLQKHRYALKSCNKPEYDIGVNEHVLLNHTFRYPKNLVWKPVSVKMISVRDGSKKDNSTGFYESLSQTIDGLTFNSYVQPHLEDKTEKNIRIDPNGKLSAPISIDYGYTNISKQKLLNNFENNVLQLIQIDANGVEIEYWSLINPFISNVKYGSLSYDNEGLVEIDFTITYDYANLNFLFDGNEKGKTSARGLIQEAINSGLGITDDD